MQFLKEKRFKQSILAVKVDDEEEMRGEIARATLKRAVHLYSSLQACDGHWPAEMSGQLFILPTLVPPYTSLSTPNLIIYKLFITIQKLYLDWVL